MDDRLFSIQDRVILITGAFGFIGWEISKTFLRCGAKVILGGHNKLKCDTIRDELEREFSSNSFLVCHLDITDILKIETCIKKSTEAFSRIDVLINNAAIDAKFDKDNSDKINVNRFEHYPIDLIKESIEINQLGTIQMTQCVCKQMVKQGSGNIINVGSSYSVIAPNQTLYYFGEGNIKYKPVDYVASKSFIPNFTRYIATFYTKENIRCNAILPHGVFNNHDEKFLSNYAQLSPMGRMCEVEELRGPFVFLASDASSYMTGSLLVVDGGWSAW